MTKSCVECDFCGGVIYPDGIYCCDCPSEISHGKNITENIENDNRPNWCPLVDVPTPHGALIDRDALKKAGRYEIYFFKGRIAKVCFVTDKYLDEFTAVIPREDGESDERD